MEEGHPGKGGTSLATQPGTDGSAGSAGHRWCLFAVLHAELPLAPSLRADLTDLGELHIGRGDGLAIEREATEERTKGRLIVPSPRHRVSKDHARLVRLEDAWMIEDTNSRNGTFVNGTRVRQAMLRPGDLIEVGGQFLIHDFVKFRQDDPPRTDLTVDPMVSQTLLGMQTLLPEYARALRDFQAVAKSDIEICLVGETGTGKEVLARAAHELSTRKGPFIAVDCASIPDDLLSSELFGAEKGAFTGARQTKGYFRDAAGGTLFLDEILSASPRLQQTLLRCLQERAVTPVGRTSPVPTDVRVVAATQTPLVDAVSKNAFRSDLKGRLEGLAFNIPPLRHRRADLGLIVARILASKGVTKADGARLSREAAFKILTGDWRENARGLAKVLGTAWHLAQFQSLGASRGEIGAAWFPDPAPLQQSQTPIPASPGSPGDEPLTSDRARAPRTNPPTEEEVLAALSATRGDVTAAAARLGRHRSVVNAVISRSGIDVRQFRRPP